jgi:hypothetical protein
MRSFVVSYLFFVVCATFNYILAENVNVRSTNNQQPTTLNSWSNTLRKIPLRLEKSNQSKRYATRNYNTTATILSAQALASFSTIAKSEYRSLPIPYPKPVKCPSYLPLERIYQLNRNLIAT